MHPEKNQERIGKYITAFQTRSKVNHLDVVSVTGAICVRIMSVGCGVFNMRCIDGDSSGLFFRGIVYVLILFIVCTTSISKH